MLRRLFAPFIALQAVLFSLFFANMAQAESPARFATLDWTVAETLIALGEPPLAVGDAQSYVRWVAEPVLPENTLDLGIRMQPNPERIWALAKTTPDLTFINSSFYASASPMLEKLLHGKPVQSVNFYQAGDAWQNIVNATHQVAKLIGKPEAAQALMQRYQQKMSEIKPHLTDFTARPVALVQFIDTRHLRIYAQNSPFGAVLSQLGFENAWQGGQNLWGFETISVTQLAKLPQNSRFVVVKPYPNNIANALAHNTLWQHLALAKDPLILPAVWTFGGVPSALRFAEVLEKALLQGGEQW